MVEKYSLNGKQLPTLPTPHDCKIIEVEFKDEYLIFKFGNGINFYDSIKKINPDANSLEPNEKSSLKDFQEKIN